jgi:hypothetical protein
VVQGTAVECAHCLHGDIALREIVVPCISVRIYHIEKCSEWKFYSWRSIFYVQRALAMEALSTPETSVSIYQTTRHNILEDSHLHTRSLRTWNLTSSTWCSCKVGIMDWYKVGPQPLISLEHFREWGIRTDRYSRRYTFNLFSLYKERIMLRTSVRPRVSASKVLGGWLTVWGSWQWNSLYLGLCCMYCNIETKSGTSLFIALRPQHLEL